MTQNLPTEFYLNQAKGLGSSSAYIHLNIQTFFQPYMEPGDLKDHGKHKIYKK